LAELLLAAATLIYIRVRSAKTNNPTSAPDMNFDSLLGVANRTPAPVGTFTAKRETPKNHGSFSSEGLRRLREALRDISFRLHGHSFKSAVRGDAVWIYLMKANHGTQEATHSAKAKLSILDDAMTMSRDAYRDRVERFLRQNGIEL